MTTMDELNKIQNKADELKPETGIKSDTDLVVDSISVGTSSPSASFRGTGDIYATSGIKAMEGLYAEAVPHGAGLEVADNSQSVTYTNVLNGDATMVGATRTITDTHASFDAGYVGQYFKVISSTPSFTGATGEIVAVPNGTTLILSFGTSADDVIPNATGMSFVIYPHPNFFVGDNGDIHASVGINDDASFKVSAAEANNDHAVHLDITAGVAGTCGVDLEIDPDTYGGVSGYCLKYDATAFAAGTTGTGFNVAVDNVGATGGDIHGIDVALSNPTNTDMEAVAVGTHEGVDVIHQHLGTPASLAAGFEGDQSGGPSYTDRTAAFDNSGTNVQIFDADNDFILLAAAAKWDEINVLLNITSSATISPTFHYITDAGAWVAFTPSDDTSGFQQNGTIRFSSDALTTWGVRTINEVTGEAGADDYYWIKITRTRNNVPTPPTESTIKITTTGTLHEWDSVGRLAIKTYSQAGEPDADDLPAGKFCFWTDTDNAKLYICYNHGGTIKTVEMT